MFLQNLFTYLRRNWVWFFVLLYVLVFCIFMPKTPMVSDEVEYFRVASGVYQVDSPEKAYGFVSDGVSYFTRYPLFGPFLLKFFVWVGLPFLFGLFFLLFGFFYFRKILDFYGVNKDYSLLFLFYPMFVYHSTTLMMDLVVTSFFVASFYYYIKERYVLMSILLGVCLLVKPLTIIYAPILFCFLLFKKNLRGIWQPVMVFCLFLVVFFIHNYVMYGSPFYSGYDFLHNVKQWDLSYDSLKDIGYYILFLNMFYPFMLLVVIFTDFKYKAEVLLLSFATIIVSSFTINHMTMNSVSDIIFGFRFVFPVVPLLMVGYFKSLRLSKLLLFLIVVFLFLLGCSLIVYKNIRSNHFYETVNLIYSKTSEGSLILTSGSANYFLEKFGNRSVLFFYMPTAYDNATLIYENIKWNYERIYTLQFKQFYSRVEEALRVSEFFDSLNKSDCFNTLSFKLCEVKCC